MATKPKFTAQYKDDGNGGMVLAAYAEGRLWEFTAVMNRPAIRDHAVGCPDCYFDGYMVELCTPGLVLDGQFK